MVKIVEEKKAEHHAIHNPHHPVIFEPAKKSKPAWIFIVLAAAIILGILVYFLLLNRPPTITTQTLKIQYMMQLEDGTILANDTAEISAGSVASTLGVSSSTLDSLIDNMAKGEQKDITLNAADAFGEYDPANVITINRTTEMKKNNEMNRTIDVTIAAATSAFSESPVVGKSYTVTGAPWEYKILSVDNSTQLVKLSQEAIAGTLIPLSEILSMNITEVTADKIKTSIVAQDQTLEIPTGNLTVKVASDYIYFTLTPPLGQRIEMGDGSAKVVSFNDTSIVLDYNPEYAGSKVILKVKMIDKITSSTVVGYSAKTIAGAPTLEVFVMSYCPYGTQMEKALIPAWKLLRDKANIELRFVSYTMHGDQETQENQRQLCLREETDKFWGYLECFLEAGDSAGCLNKVGVDAAKLNTCISTKADSYWQVDKDLNTKYGVQGSPTVVLDGKEIQPSSRSPEAVKQAICDAFTTAPPTECSQTLSDTAATAGFGAAASSSSSSSGGCASA
jgi:FKBP-type peptidyl-prolyl cis-trans isomerase 2/glutaredoxin